MKLPTQLASHRVALEAALEVEIPGAWTPGEKYMKAAQPESIAEVLVQALHQELAPASIAYLFREKMKKRGRVGLGKAKKASPTVSHLTGFDLLVEFNWSQWTLLTPEQRIALVDHELSHFARAEDAEDGNSWALVSHDVEEFSGIVRRWGLWLPDLRDFNNHLKRAQVELFPELELVERIIEETR